MLLEDKWRQCECVFLRDLVTKEHVAEKATCLKAAGALPGRSHHQGVCISWHQAAIATAGTRA